MDEEEQVEAIRQSVFDAGMGSLLSGPWKRMINDPKIVFPTAGSGGSWHHYVNDYEKELWPHFSKVVRMVIYVRCVELACIEMMNRR